MEYKGVNNTKNGIDISKWQGAVNWSKLSHQHYAGELDFVIIRAGYGGSTVDPFFEANYASCINAGIPCGAYWYAYWKNGITPTMEAEGFLKAVEGKTLQYGLWYDVEYEQDILSLDKTTRTNKVLEALQKLADSGRYCGLYASTDMVNNRLDYERLRNYDLWVAQYGSKNTCKIPYGIWQYSSSGTIDGISGRVDQNRAYKSYPSIVTGTLANGRQKKPVLAPVQKEEKNQTWSDSYTSMTTGDLQKFLELAKSLGIYVIGDLHIGPYTKGDRAQFRQLAKELNITTREV